MKIVISAILFAFFITFCSSNLGDILSSEIQNFCVDRVETWRKVYEQTPERFKPTVLKSLIDSLIARNPHVGKIKFLK
jgi:hypothetical protein